MISESVLSIRRINDSVTFLERNISASHSHRLAIHVQNQLHADSFDDLHGLFTTLLELLRKYKRESDSCEQLTKETCCALCKTLMRCYISICLQWNGTASNDSKNVKLEPLCGQLFAIMSQISPTEVLANIKQVLHRFVGQDENGNFTALKVIGYLQFNLAGIADLLDMLSGVITSPKGLWRKLALMEVALPLQNCILSWMTRESLEFQSLYLNHYYTYNPNATASINRNASVGNRPYAFSTASINLSNSCSFRGSNTGYFGDVLNSHHVYPPIPPASGSHINAMTATPNYVAHNTTLANAVGKLLDVLDQWTNSGSRKRSILFPVMCYLMRLIPNELQQAVDLIADSAIVTTIDEDSSVPSADNIHTTNTSSRNAVSAATGRPTTTTMVQSNLKKLKFKENTTVHVVARILKSIVKCFKPSKLSTFMQKDALILSELSLIFYIDYLLISAILILASQLYENALEDMMDGNETATIRDSLRYSLSTLNTSVIASSLFASASHTLSNSNGGMNENNSNINDTVAEDSDGTIEIDDREIEEVDEKNHSNTLNNNANNPSPPRPFSVISNSSTTMGSMSDINYTTYDIIITQAHRIKLDEMLLSGAYPTSIYQNSIDAALEKPVISVYSTSSLLSSYMWAMYYLDKPSFIRLCTAALSPTSPLPCRLGAIQGISCVLQRICPATLQNNGIMKQAHPIHCDNSSIYNDAKRIGACCHPSITASVLSNPFERDILYSVQLCSNIPIIGGVNDNYSSQQVLKPSNTGYDNILPVDDRYWSIGAASQVKSRLFGLISAYCRTNVRLTSGEILLNKAISHSLLYTTYHFIYEAEVGTSSIDTTTILSVLKLIIDNPCFVFIRNIDVSVNKQFNIEVVSNNKVFPSTFLAYFCGFVSDLISLLRCKETEIAESSLKALCSIVQDKHVKVLHFTAVSNAKSTSNSSSEQQQRNNSQSTFAALICVTSIMLIRLAMLISTYDCDCVVQTCRIYKMLQYTLNTVNDFLCHSDDEVHFQLSELPLPIVQLRKHAVNTVEAAIVLHLSSSDSDIATVSCKCLNLLCLNHDIIEGRQYSGSGSTWYIYNKITDDSIQFLMPLMRQSTICGLLGNISAKSLGVRWALQVIYHRWNDILQKQVKSCLDVTSSAVSFDEWSNFCSLLCALADGLGEPLELYDVLSTIIQYPPPPVVINNGFIQQPLQGSSGCKEDATALEENANNNIERAQRANYAAKSIIEELMGLIIVTNTSTISNSMNISNNSGSTSSTTNVISSVTNAVDRKISQNAFTALGMYLNETLLSYLFDIVTSLMSMLDFILSNHKSYVDSQASPSHPPHYHLSHAHQVASGILHSASSVLSSHLGSSGNAGAARHGSMSTSNIVLVFGMLDLTKCNDMSLLQVLATVNSILTMLTMVFSRPWYSRFDFSSTNVEHMLTKVVCVVNKLKSHHQTVDMFTGTVVNVGSIVGNSDPTHHSSKSHKQQQHNYRESNNPSGSAVNLMVLDQISLADELRLKRKTADMFEMFMQCKAYISISNSFCIRIASGVMKWVYNCVGLHYNVNEQHSASATAIPKDPSTIQTSMPVRSMSVTGGKGLVAMAPMTAGNAGDGNRQLSTNANVLDIELCRYTEIACIKMVKILFMDTLIIPDEIEGCAEDVATFVLLPTSGIGNSDSNAGGSNSTAGRVNTIEKQSQIFFKFYHVICTILYSCESINSINNGMNMSPYGNKYQNDTKQQQYIIQIRDNCIETLRNLFHSNVLVGFRHICDGAIAEYNSDNVRLALLQVLCGVMEKQQSSFGKIASITANNTGDDEDVIEAHSYSDLLLALRELLIRNFRENMTTLLRNSDDADNNNGNIPMASSTLVLLLCNTVQSVKDADVLADVLIKACTVYTKTPSMTYSDENNADNNSIAKDYCIIHRLLLHLLPIEINNTIRLGSLFRNESICTKLMGYYLNIVAKPFLKAILEGVINKVMENTLDIEALCSGNAVVTDSSAEPLNTKPDGIVKVTNLLNELFQQIITCSQQSDLISNDIKSIFYCIKTEVVKKFTTSTNTAAYCERIAVGGYICLRLICPALTMPYKYDIISSAAALPSKPAITAAIRPLPTLNKTVSKSLVTISKLLQHLANGTNVTDGYLQPFDRWIESNAAKFLQFCSFISSPIVVANGAKNLVTTVASLSKMGEYNSHTNIEDNNDCSSDEEDYIGLDDDIEDYFNSSNISNASGNASNTLENVSAVLDRTKPTKKISSGVINSNSKINNINATTQIQPQTMTLEETVNTSNVEDSEIVSENIPNLNEINDAEFLSQDKVLMDVLIKLHNYLYKHRVSIVRTCILDKQQQQQQSSSNDDKEDLQVMEPLSQLNLHVDSNMELLTNEQITCKDSPEKHKAINGSLLSRVLSKQLIVSVELSMLLPKLITLLGNPDHRTNDIQLLLGNINEDGGSSNRDTNDASIHSMNSNALQKSFTQNEYIQYALQYFTADCLTFIAVVEGKPGFKERYQLLQERQIVYNMMSNSQDAVIMIVLRRVDYSTDMHLMLFAIIKCMEKIVITHKIKEFDIVIDSTAYNFECPTEQFMMKKWWEKMKIYGKLVIAKCLRKVYIIFPSKEFSDMGRRILKLWGIKSIYAAAVITVILPTQLAERLPFVAADVMQSTAFKTEISIEKRWACTRHGKNVEVTFTNRMVLLETIDKFGGMKYKRTDMIPLQYIDKVECLGTPGQLLYAMAETGILGRGGGGQHSSVPIGGGASAVVNPAQLAQQFAAKRKSLGSGISDFISAATSNVNEVLVIKLSWNNRSFRLHCHNAKLLEIAFNNALMVVWQQSALEEAVRWAGIKSTVSRESMPGMLLFVAIYNLFSSYEVTRRVSYALIGKLHECFQIPTLYMPLLSNETICIPLNITSFALALSSKLAKQRPEYAYEYVSESIASVSTEKAMNYNSRRISIILCLQPWLYPMNQLLELIQQKEDSNNDIHNYSNSSSLPSKQTTVTTAYNATRDSITGVRITANSVNRNSLSFSPPNYNRQSILVPPHSTPSPVPAKDWNSDNDEDDDDGGAEDDHLEKYDEAEEEDENDGDGKAKGDTSRHSQKKQITANVTGSSPVMSKAIAATANINSSTIGNRSLDIGLDEMIGKVLEIFDLIFIVYCEVEGLRVILSTHFWNEIGRFEKLTGLAIKYFITKWMADSRVPLEEILRNNNTNNNDTNAMVCTEINGKFINSNAVCFDPLLSCHPRKPNHYSLSPFRSLLTVSDTLKRHYILSINSNRNDLSGFSGSSNVGSMNANRVSQTAYSSSNGAVMLTPRSASVTLGYSSSSLYSASTVSNNMVVGTTQDIVTCIMDGNLAALTSCSSVELCNLTSLLAVSQPYLVGNILLSKLLRLVTQQPVASSASVPVNSSTAVVNTPPRPNSKSQQQLNASNNAANTEYWIDIVALFRPLLYLPFQNSSILATRLPDLLTLVIILVGQGPTNLRTGVHVFICNILHALIGIVSNDSNKLSRALAEMTSNAISNKQQQERNNATVSRSTSSRQQSLQQQASVSSTAAATVSTAVCRRSNSASPMPTTSLLSAAPSVSDNSNGSVSSTAVKTPMPSINSISVSLTANKTTYVVPLQTSQQLSTSSVVVPPSDINLAVLKNIFAIITCHHFHYIFYEAPQVTLNNLEILVAVLAEVVLATNKSKLCEKWRRRWWKALLVLAKESLPSITSARCFVGVSMVVKPSEVEHNTDGVLTYIFQGLKVAYQYDITSSDSNQLLLHMLRCIAKIINHVPLALLCDMFWLTMMNISIANTMLFPELFKLICAVLAELLYRVSHTSSACDYLELILLRNRYNKHGVNATTGTATASGADHRPTKSVILENFEKIIGLSFCYPPCDGSNSSDSIVSTEYHFTEQDIIKFTFALSILLVNGVNISVNIKEDVVLLLEKLAKRFKFVTANLQQLGEEDQDVLACSSGAMTGYTVIILGLTSGSYIHSGSNAQATTTSISDSNRSSINNSNISGNNRGGSTVNYVELITSLLTVTASTVETVTGAVHNDTILHSPLTGIPTLVKNANGLAVLRQLYTFIHFNNDLIGLLYVLVITSIIEHSCEEDEQSVVSSCELVLTSMRYLPHIINLLTDLIIQEMLRLCREPKYKKYTKYLSTVIDGCYCVTDIIAATKTQLQYQQSTISTSFNSNSNIVNSHFNHDQLILTKSTANILRSILKVDDFNAIYGIVLTNAMPKTSTQGANSLQIATITSVNETYMMCPPTPTKSVPDVLSAHRHLIITGGSVKENYNNSSSGSSDARSSTSSTLHNISASSDPMISITGGDVSPQKLTNHSSIDINSNNDSKDNNDDNRNDNKQDPTNLVANKQLALIDNSNIKIPAKDVLKYISCKEILSISHFERKVTATQVKVKNAVINIITQYIDVIMQQLLQTTSHYRHHHVK